MEITVCSGSGLLKSLEGKQEKTQRWFASIVRSFQGRQLMASYLYCICLAMHFYVYSVCRSFARKHQSMQWGFHKRASISRHLEINIDSLDRITSGLVIMPMLVHPWFGIQICNIVVNKCVHLVASLCSNLSKWSSLLSLPPTKKAPRPKRLRDEQFVCR